MSNLRRLKLEPNREAGHAHVLDAVTGETLGQPIPKRELMKCLDDLDAKTLMERRSNSIKASLDLFPNSADSELALGVARWQEDNGCDYAVALREFTATAKGAELWHKHVLDLDAEAK